MDFINETRTALEIPDPALIKGQCLWNNLTDADFDVIRHLMEEEHHCLTGENCNQLERESGKRQGMTYYEYLFSRKQHREFVEASAHSSNVVTEIMQVKATASTEWLACILGVNVSEVEPYSGIYFWRMFKRLYYVHYKRIIPVCVWKSVADVFGKTRRNPQIFEDLLIAFWRNRHPRIGLKTRSTFAKRIFTIGPEFRFESDHNGVIALRKNDEIVEIIHADRRTKEWKQKVVKKRRLPVVMPISTWNEISDDSIPSMRACICELEGGALRHPVWGCYSQKCKYRTTNYRMNEAHGLVDFLSDVSKGHIAESTQNIRDASSELVHGMKEMNRRSQDLMANLEFGSADMRVAMGIVPELISNIKDASMRITNQMQEELTNVRANIMGEISNIGRVQVEGSKMLYSLIGSRTLLVMEAFCLYFVEEYLPRWMFYLLLGQAIVRWFNLTQYIPWIVEFMSEAFAQASAATDLLPPGQLREGMEFNQAHAGTSCTQVLTGGLFGILCMALFKRTPGKSETEKFVKSMSGLFSIKKGFDVIPDLFKSLETLITKVITWFGIIDDGVARNMAELDLNMETFEEWVAGVTELATDENREIINMDEDVQKRVIELRAQGTVYMKMFQRKSWPPHFRSTFTLVWRMLTDIATLAEKAKNFNGFRIDPYCVWVCGRVRVGKSTMCDELALIMTEALGESKSHAIYPRGGSAHWDRYSKQTCLYIDDALQVRGQVAEERVNEFISMRSNDAFILPMASLEDKGIAFESKVMICSSNVAYPDVTTLVHTEDAVHSRRHAVIDCELKPEYYDAKTGLPDTQRIAKVNLSRIAAGAKNSFEHLTFSLVPSLKSGTRDNSKQRMSWEDMQKYISEQCVQHIDIQKQLVANRFKRVFGDAIPNVAHAGTTYKLPIRLVRDEKLQEYLRRCDQFNNTDDTFEITRDEWLALYMYGLVDGTLVFTPREIKWKCIGENIFDTAMELFMRLGDMYYGQLANEILTLAGRGEWRIPTTDDDDILRCSGIDRIMMGVKSMRKSCATIYERVNNYIRERDWLSTLQNNLTTAAVTAATVAGVIALFGVYRSRVDETMNIPHVQTSGDPTTGKAARLKTVKQPIPLNTAHDDNDQNAMELIQHRVRKHLYRIERGSQYTMALATSGQNLIVPYHLVSGHKDTDEYRLMGSDGLKTIMFSVRASQIVRVGSDDMAIIKDIPRVPAAPDFIKHMLKEEDLAYTRQLDAVMVHRGLTSDEFTLSKGNVRAWDETFTSCHMQKEEVYKVRRGWKHDMPGAKGMCMAPIIAVGSRYPRKMIGFHISGGSQGMVALCPIQEDFKGIFQVTCDMEVNDAHISEILETRGNDPIQEGYVPLGYLPQSKGDYNPEKTDIIPTIIHDKIRIHTTEPAILRKTDPRNVNAIHPFRNALLKYTKRTRPFMPGDRELALEYLTTDVIEHFETREWVHWIDEQTIVNGIETSGRYKKMELTTSPGWPWKLAAGKGKKRWFVERGEKFFMNEELSGMVIEKLEMLRDGKRPPWIWAHCLKDERRPLEKIEAVKTRVFTAGPMDQIICVRALTMHFVASMYGAWGRSFSSVGLNPLGPDWSLLAHNMLSRGQVHGDADYGAYDGTLDPDLIRNCMDAIYEWWVFNSSEEFYEIRLQSGRVIFTKDEYKRALRILAVEFTHSIAILRRKMDYKVQGNPSGNPLTVVINTMVGFQYLSIAYMNLALRTGIVPKYRNFKRDIWLNVFGDDFTISMNEYTAQWFNTRTISQFLGEFGFELTPATKSGEHEDRTLEELQFLKRKWVRHDRNVHRYKAPIDENTVYEYTNWIRNGPDNMEQTIIQLETALTECHMHGQSFYDRFREELNRHSKDLGVHFPDEYEMIDTVWNAQFE